MNIDNLKQLLPEFAKDIKLNLSSIMQEDAELSANQVIGIALASAYATKHAIVIQHIEAQAKELLAAEYIEAAKAAATIMAMNNVYYRFLQLVEDDNYKQLPARLRMNIIANPGIDKVDFELYSLAVSAINACGTCVKAHANVIEKAGITPVGIQNTVRIAAVINAAAQALAISE